MSKKKTGDLGRILAVEHRGKNRGPAATLDLARTRLLYLQNRPDLCPAPYLTVAQFEADVNALAATQVASLTREIGKHTDRDKAFFKVVANLDFVRAFVQWKMDNDRENAAVIAAAAGMTTSGPRSKPPATLRSRKSKQPHCFDVTSPVTRSRQSHNWQLSIDGGRTYLDAPSTTKATTTFGPFTPGMTVLVRHASIDKTGVSNWSQPLPVIVT